MTKYIDAEKKSITKPETKTNRAGVQIAVLKGKRYIVSCSKLDDVNASGCPCVGQIATNSKLLALFLYHRWNKFSYKYVYSIAVQLWERNANGNYDVIKR